MSLLSNMKKDGAGHGPAVYKSARKIRAYLVLH
jgi:hypothetical protein